MRDYLAAGWNPFPLPLGAKYPPPTGVTGRGAPPVTASDIDAWAEDYPAPHNVGIRVPRNVVGIDVDAYDGKCGAKTLAALESLWSPLPVAPMSSARGDGVSGIRFFRIPDEYDPSHLERAILAVGGTGVEVIRHDHRYAVVSPSVHPSGASYCWDTGSIPAIDDLPMLPREWCVDTPESEPESTSDRVFSKEQATDLLARSVARVASAKSGQINEELNRAGFFLFHLVPALLEKDQIVDALLDAQRDAWVAAGNPDDNDLTAARKTLASAWRSATGPGQWIAMCGDGDPMFQFGGVESSPEEGKSTKNSGVFFTDAAFSEWVAEKVLVGNAIYVPNLGWYTWDGIVWSLDSEGTAPVELIRLYCLDRLRQAVRAKESADPESAESDQASALSDAWRTTCSRSRIMSILSLAQGQRAVLRGTTDLDSNPDIINTPTGVVDLTDGSTSPHDYRFYCTKVTKSAWQGVDYENADWKKVLSAIPEDAQDFVQVFLGQAVTGYTNADDRLALFQGDGQNGKGLLINDGITSFLGSYAVKVPDSIVVSRGFSSHPTDKMCLLGTRLALVDETPESGALDITAVKGIVGQPTVVGRRMRQDFTEFPATHTLVILSNPLPRVGERDRGTWRRLVRIPMPYTFKPDGERLCNEFDIRADTGIRRRLSEDPDIGSAALAWLVRGAIRWYQDGRTQTIPPVVLAATAEWRQEGDPMWNYIEEKLIFDPNAAISSSDLFSDMNNYFEGVGAPTASQRIILDRFRTHPLVQDHPVQQRKARASGVTSRPSTALGDLGSGTMSVIQGVGFVTQEIW